MAGAERCPAAAGSGLAAAAEAPPQGCRAAPLVLPKQPHPNFEWAGFTSSIAASPSPGPQQQQKEKQQQNSGHQRAPAGVMEAPLTRLSVGMWASKRHRACTLLLLPEQQQLVVLCDRRQTAPRPSPSRFSLAGLELKAKSPFASGHAAFRHAGCVHAFELPFCSIRGLDYANPLCYEARLVLETVNLRKREFATVSAWIVGG